MFYIDSTSMSRFLTSLIVLFSSIYAFAAHHAPLSFEGAPGQPGNGKHIVLIAGDEEYRSEESCPMLAKILSKHHGFKTTVLFSLDPEGGYIDVNAQKNIPHTEVLDDADLLIFGLRFRDLPDNQLQPFVDYLKAGKPLFGFRTSTHAFKTKSKLGGINWSNFGPDILGEGWAGHYGKHRVQGARGIAERHTSNHPILRGVSEIFAESDVYGVKRVSRENATILIEGYVTENLLPSSAIVESKTRQPAIWLKDYQVDGGKKGTALCSTMGSSCDLDDESLRRLFINASYHLTGLDVPNQADVSYVDPFKPSQFAFLRQKGFFKKLNLKPADFGLGKSPSISSSADEMVATSVKNWKAAQEKKKKPTSKTSGPKINSTETSIEEQQKDKKRPIYLKPGKAKPAATSLPLQPKKGDSIVLIGNSLAERMLNYGHLEGLIHANFPESNLTFRNMGFPAHTPAFRPEAGNKEPWAFPGANKFRPEIKSHLGTGHYPRPDDWLRIIEADTIVAFFGFNESFDGEKGVANFRAELAAFVDHTLTQAYNTKTSPKLVLATPIATENLPEYLLPNATDRNAILAQYTNAVKEVAAEKKVGVLDIFTPTSKWSGITINGVHLSDSGYAKLAPVIFEALFGKAPAQSAAPLLKEAIKDKNWFWRNDYRMPNGVHSYGRRWAPYGNINYPEEIEKLRQMTVLRDQNIWKIARGESSSLKVDDASTRPLSKVETNYKPSEKNGQLTYLTGDEATEKMTLPNGYEVSTFASEKEFPNLANPMQMRFDNQGRLWVSTMPSYPHYRPGDPKPNDMLLIYEDTDGDGRADKETVWAQNLHIPIGFDFAKDGVYITEGSQLTFHQDTDGDGISDKKSYLLDGFDPHDSHHSQSAFTTDHGGGLFLLEGRFLHSQIETPYGPQRMTDGGVWRWDHKSWKLDRVMQTDMSNPWGIVFDEYGQNILNDASGGQHHWMAGYGIKMPHGAEMPKVHPFNYEHRIRPTSGSEILSSRHFPDDQQGDYLFGNTIGFLGIKQMAYQELPDQINGKWKQDLIESTDGNFRPADLEFAFDGSLYFIDWHNTLIGHMQHSARDPNRHPNYGRIYRINYPSRPLVDAPQIAGASIATLFENLKLHELQTRKRSQRELRWRDSKEVLPAALAFAKVNASDERLVLEALWATWGQHQPSTDLIEQCLAAKDERVRAGATRVVRHSLHLLSHPEKFLLKAATDSHSRVRIEALNGASWLGGKAGADVLLTVASQPRTAWINNSLNCAIKLQKADVEVALKSGKYDIADLDLLLNGRLKTIEKPKNHISSSVQKAARKNKTLGKALKLGQFIFQKEGSCGTCHQEDGEGLKGIYPPLAKSKWVTGNTDRLIKLTIHGLMGPIEVRGVKYAGNVPMTPVGKMYNDKEVAAALTYVRSAWGNEASMITEEQVKTVRAATADRTLFYKPEELLKEHPMEK